MIKKTVRKWFWVWNQEKEKKFLEDMTMKGLRLVQVGIGTYIFEEDKPKKVIYQFDFRVNGKQKEEEYLQIFKDAGWTCMSRFGSWYYFAHDWSEAEPQTSLFSNNESNRVKYRQLLLFLMIVGFPLYFQLIIMFPNMDSTEFEFPGFHFYFRIIVVILTALHLLAVGRILLMYRKLKNVIQE